MVRGCFDTGQTAAKSAIYTVRQNIKGAALLSNWTLRRISCAVPSVCDKTYLYQRPSLPYNVINKGAVTRSVFVSAPTEGCLLPFCFDLATSICEPHVLSVLVTSAGQLFDLDITTGGNFRPYLIAQQGSAAQANLCIVDQLLSAKLSHELDLEHQSRDSSELPESFQRFLQDSGFQVYTSRPFDHTWHY